MAGHKTSSTIHAEIGDRIVVRPHVRGLPARSGEVVDARGRGGEPPFIVRWDDSGRLALYFPGRDAKVQHVRDEN
jgi:hypothetical protein